MDMTNGYTEITVDAKLYEDCDDCLTAAATEYAREHHIADWQVEARWADDSRDAIVLTVPEEVVS
jgi:hypothetical protein